MYRKLGLKIAAGCWGLLGCKRGMHEYDYKYNKYNKNNTIHYNYPYLYSVKTLLGIGGVILYMNPLIIPFVIPREIFRLEVNLRNMEHEKKGDYYNKLI